MSGESLILSGIGTGLLGARQVGAMLGYKPTPHDNFPDAVLPIEIPYSRDSDAMEFVDGLWQAVPKNKPRRYNDAYLNEPLAVNICRRSTKLATSPWLISNISINETSIIAPDGTLTGNKITLLSGAPSALERTSQNFTLSADLTYTLSCFVKAGDFTGSMLLRGDVNNNTANLEYNFTTGVVSSVGGRVISASKQIGTDGWVRLILVFTTVLNPSIDINVFNGQQLNKFYYAWGAQLETGSVATSPIITAGAAVTRLADVPSAVTINPLLNDWTLFFDLGDCATSSLFNYPIQVKADLNGSGATKINIGGSSTGLNYIIYNEADAEIMNSTLTQLGRKKFAIKKEGTTLKLFVNGALVYTKLSSAIGVVKSLILTTSLHTIRYNTFKSYPSAESDAACIAETTL
jgi:hypothetical protein